MEKFNNVCGHAILAAARLDDMNTRKGASPEGKRSFILRAGRHREPIALPAGRDGLEALGAAL
jgi:hypothetical protein